jgi:hypothetical protein
MVWSNELSYPDLMMKEKFYGGKEKFAAYQNRERNRKKMLVAIPFMIPALFGFDWVSSRISGALAADRIVAVSAADASDALSCGLPTKEIKTAFTDDGKSLLAFEVKGKKYLLRTDSTTSAETTVNLIRPGSTHVTNDKASVIRCP